jgi:alpha-mannosidase
MQTVSRKIHLICNAHLDPVWLWEWEEGAAAAVSTFRSAVKLCEDNPTFVFNHNEALLYEWVELYDQRLFRRIQKMVALGRWHIMGGWYLQPDCNMPSGESFIRQIARGRRYFSEKFGVRPTTAINFDPFGHSRGLVQILKRCGFDSYLFCRPGPKDSGHDVTTDEFRWIGFDGSEVIASRAWDHYLSLYGQARRKTENHLVARPTKSPDYVLWGVGNHGGGPSRLDLAELDRLRAARPDIALVHSTPENYFKELQAQHRDLPQRANHINPWGVGCYTSQIRIKQRHRQLENALAIAEKICSAASVNRLCPYPASDLKDAERDLLISQFHDILPGSSVPAVEEQSLRLMDHGLEILARVRARAFFALAAGQPLGADGDIPILVFNPHPYPVCAVVECEFQLENQNHGQTWSVFDVFHNGRLVPAQTEQEASNINLDWRKRVVFQAELAPGVMSRFDSRARLLPRKPRLSQPKRGTLMAFVFPGCSVKISRRTGLMEDYRVGGQRLLGGAAFRPTVWRDNADPWHMQTHRIDRLAGAFRLLSADEAGAFAGLGRYLAPVRVIEAGPVRTVVEALFGYRKSRLRLRYALPCAGSEIEVELKVYWHEADRMLKLALPCRFPVDRFLGQTAFGVQELRRDGGEGVAQQWVAVVARDGRRAISVVNDGTYGFSLKDKTVFLNLLRSPAFSAHPIENRPLLPLDRHTPRIDQGERTFRFWLNAGPGEDRLSRVDREAQLHNEVPPVLSYFPDGGGRGPKPFVKLAGDRVLISALRRLDYNRGYLLRLFEPTGRNAAVTLRFPMSQLVRLVRLAPWQFRTFVLNQTLTTFRESDPLGQPQRGPARRAH